MTTKINKFLFASFIILILFSACENRKETSKIYSAFDNNYLTENEFDQKPVFSDNNKYGEVVKKISEKIANYKSELSSAAVDLKFEAYIYVNKSGEVDKIFVVDAPNQEIANIISNELIELVFDPAKKDGESVPARFKFRYNESNSVDGETYFVAVEEMPSPIGGIEAIAENVVYPEIAKRAGIEGRVFVKAYIDTNGNVAKTEIIKGIGAGCDEAAMEAVKKSKFTPGKQRGEKVNVQVSIPILFKLQ